MGAIGKIQKILLFLEKKKQKDFISAQF